MRLGTLNTRCRIEYIVTAADPATGYDVATWTLLRECYCSIQDVLPSSAESIAQGVAVSRSQTRWRARYSNDIDSSMRIVTSNPANVYNIVGGPSVIGSKEGVELKLEMVST